MENGWISNFIKLTEFLGVVLGPDFEVVLHDTSEPENSIMALANGHISGRTIGAPLTDFAMQKIEEKAYETEDSILNYPGIVTGSQNIIRSSTFFIKDQYGGLQGLLCVNYDDSRHRDLIDKLLKFRHPDAYVESNFVYDAEKARTEPRPNFVAESFHDSISTLILDAINQVVRENGVPVERLTMAERINIVSILDKKGVFLLKNSVKQVAEQLNCSTATLYRYINKIRS